MSSHNSKYYVNSFKTNPVKSKNIKTLFQKFDQSTKKSTETSLSTSIDLSSETTPEVAVQLTSTLVSVQPTSILISTQLTPTTSSIGVP